MNKLKFLLLTLSSSSLLYAQCNYNLDVSFDFVNKQIEVKTDIKDTQKSLELDISKFNIENKALIDSKIKDGANKLSFSYKKSIEHLDENFVYLLGNWYPSLNSNCSYDIKTNLTESYKTVYENTDEEIDNFNFIASKKFIVRIKKHKDVAIKTYFLRDDEELVKKYFDKTIEYIDLYEKRIAKFPYNEFKIVENVYQTGYSMPTFTLIGSRLLGKDYILNQSLGHEILHQYFGNSVFNDFSKGNWVEGLTTFLADDYYKSLNNTDIQNRKIVLNQYENYVNSKNEFPIREFRYRHNKVSSMVGYSKLAFVFHMLEKKIGKEQFISLIKKFYKEYSFKEANLDDIALLFNNNTNIELNGFFKQWFDKKGLIDFELENIKTTYNKNGFWLSFDVIQKEKEIYEFDLPLSIKTYDENIERIVSISKQKQEVKLKFDSEVLNFTVDKNYDLFRKLSKEERFPAISALITEKDLIAIVNKEDSKEYEKLKRALPNIKFINSDDVKFKEIKENSVIFLDSSNRLINQFYPKIDIKKENSYLKVMPHVYNDKKVMAVLNFGEYKTRYLMMLKHFSQYRQIVLSQEETKKDILNTINGIVVKMAASPKISKVIKKKSINDIYKEIEDKKIVYVGESHTSFEDHLNQLRVIKSLHSNGKKVAIALEMFQKPFQKDLDEYIEGKTTLNEFLKNSEYYKRWVYDYKLYKPIIDYAKKNKIPLVALNIDRKVNKQVSSKGLLSLDKEQKTIAPKEIDQSNVKYKKSLENTFKSHIPVHSSSKMNFDYFYQSQLIWDETMAENIDNYMKKNPNRTVVVLAGSGHIEKHNGIPSRVYRRNSLPYQVILQTPHKVKEGDIVTYSKGNITLAKEKKIGIVLKSNDELTVIRVVKDSLASKLKIKKDDKLLEVNGEKVESISDIKRTLFFMDDVDKTTVKVKRKDEIKLLTQNM